MEGRVESFFLWGQFLSKIVTNLHWTYKKFQYEGEPYRCSGKQDP